MGRLVTVTWRHILRAALCAMWLVHGLEKFGVRWPKLLRGGTNSVPDMLALIGDETPIGFVHTLIEGMLLPAGHWLQYPVGATEVAIGVLIGAGVGLNWAASVGIALQFFIGLGFFRLDWPLLYPVVILMHLALLPMWMEKGRDKRVRLACRLVLSMVWLYESRLGVGSNTYQTWLTALLAVALLWEPLVIVAAPAGMVATAIALATGKWGVSPWSYYLVVAAHVAVWVAALQSWRVRAAPNDATLSR